MKYGKIQYELRDNVATILLNDPEKLNAMSRELAAEMTHGIRRAEGEARAIVIGTTGRVFSAGGDLGEGGFDMDDPQRDLGEKLEPFINPLILAMRDSPLPVITSIRGAAAGVGCGIGLAGDLIIAAEKAFFYLAFCKIGLSPDGGSSYFLSQAIGRVRAMELMLLGERLYAPKALEWGLINRVVSDEELSAATHELATRLAQGPRSLGMIKASAWSALDAPLEKQLLLERRNQRTAGLTEDCYEGVAAFREKRPPIFKGR
ncbi:2-(1,2-epoxy-1,2-dihydrophenyl)acetyl-CoA isomerase [Sphingobium sp. SCG-1]|uniref:enoyl-CoA hydratase-related protein n=1 Tax=Sphingobium sp. SCG-1 TaxID=2072936 RepID=UPI000CD6BD14|nr:enoyl-CoA hydratase-related protein [Sphingobium sp. SCG-1]AUW57107.1 2-(1,2-epoxy-1,2-dihydrophenyl)acetyl-CoA isomerase [Sphingobium sp. SCG-1]